MKIKWTLLGSLVCAATAFAQMDMQHMDMGSKPSQSKFFSDMDRWSRHRANTRTFEAHCHFINHLSILETGVRSGEKEDGDLILQQSDTAPIKTP